MEEAALRRGTERSLGALLQGDNERPSRAAPVTGSPPPACPCVLPCAGQVRAAWEGLQSAVARYGEEARAAADFFQGAAGLMVAHLRNALLEVGPGGNSL
jgi:hypothetical protein